MRFDGRNRALIEAGRALHLDYAAPGADMVAANINGQASRVRGTSFAAPIVAGYIAQSSVERVRSSTQDLGSRGRDDVYGEGLVGGNLLSAAR